MLIALLAHASSAPTASVRCVRVHKVTETMDLNINKRATDQQKRSSMQRCHFLLCLLVSLIVCFALSLSSVCACARITTAHAAFRLCQKTSALFVLLLQFWEFQRLAHKNSLLTTGFIGPKSKHRLVFEYYSHKTRKQKMKKLKTSKRVTFFFIVRILRAGICPHVSQIYLCIELAIHTYIDTGYS